MLAVLLVGLLAGPMYGQGGATGAISGTVVDTSGGAVSAAEVQIIDARSVVVCAGPWTRGDEQVE